MPAKLPEARSPMARSAIRAGRAGFERGGINAGDRLKKGIMMKRNPTTFRALETGYKGYKFRSRTEARWAVFFDHLNYQWFYEHQGYAIPEEGQYLPDFWIPRFRKMSYAGVDGPVTVESAFIEVKGEYPPDDKIRLMAKLCQITGHNGYIVIGVPDTDCWVIDVSYAKDRALSEIDSGKFIPYEYWFADENMSPFSGSCDASNAAKSARFEFGQYGA